VIEWGYEACIEVFRGMPCLWFHPFDMSQKELCQPLF
jgi:hypothetical protein